MGKSQLRMLKNEKTSKPRHFCVDSRKIRKSYTSNDSETKVKQQLKKLNYH